MTRRDSVIRRNSPERLRKLGLPAWRADQVAKQTAWIASDAGQKAIRDTMARLADEVEVQENREQFCADIWIGVNIATMGCVQMRGRSGPRDPDLWDAEMKIRDAYKAVNKLCDVQEKCASKYRDFNYGSVKKPRTLQDCEGELRGMIAGFAVLNNNFFGPLPRSGPGSRDLAPNHLFEQFVVGLFSKIEQYGGKATFSHQNGTGTILEAVKLLSPFLPPDFIPKPIPSIRRAVIEKRRRDAIDKDFQAGG